MTDRKGKKVVGVAPGRNNEAFAAALIDMEIRGADIAKIKTVTMDMSNAYIKGASEHLPQAEIVFDRFHVSKLLNEVVDTVRRTEQRQAQHVFKKSRYLWLRRESTLTVKQQAHLKALSEAYPTIGEMHRLKELFREVWDAAEHSNRLTPLNQWLKQAWATGLTPLQDFVNTLRSHWYGIKTYFKQRLTNAYAENVNLKIQQIKRVARGYRNVQSFTLMIYFTSVN